MSKRSLAPIWKRAIAYFVDGFIVGIIYLILKMILPLYLISNLNLITIMAFAISWLYFAGMESSPEMATLGKKIMNLTVGNEQGEQISFHNASFRWLLKSLSFVMLLGFLFAFIDRDNQFFYDRFAKSRVFED
ncbi:MAG TPA: RDD family protein [Holophagaceae bacterium]|nr:RDD family protein [Geothrix sp.]HJW32979.1 RDD family protein [Holophagaceae bacterium]